MTSLSARRRHPLATVLVLGLGLFLVGGLYAAVGHASQAGAASTTATTQQVSQGRQLYLTGCSSCHGLNAAGRLERARRLIGVGAAAVDFQVGTGRMPLAGPTTQAARGPVTYTDEEIAALAAYVASLAPGPAIPTAEQLDYTDADLAAGRRAVPHQLRLLPQLRRPRRRAHPRQVRPDASPSRARSTSTRRCSPARRPCRSSATRR